MWLASNPDKARTERFILWYSPVWIAAMAAVMLSGWFEVWSDPAYLAFGLALVAAPAGFALKHRGYALKLNLFVAIFSFIGNFIYTHYFFDYLGMHYAFPTSWNLQAREIGHSAQTVPVFLYLLTHAYFLTYHVVMVVLLRKAKQTAFGRTLAGTIVSVALLAYVIAFAETFGMATPQLAHWFNYADRTRMLTIGSVFYGTYFVSTLPFVFRIDEGDERWTFGRVAVEAFAAGMIALLLLELCVVLIGRIA
jgi:cycloeucalenol cycloisomerase